MIGGGYRGPKTVEYNARWTVEGDPRPAQIEQERRDAEKKRDEDFKTVIEAADKAADERVQAAVAAGDEILTPENAEIGMRVRDHYHQEDQIVCGIETFSGKPTLFTRSADEPDNAPRLAPWLWFTIPRQDASGGTGAGPVDAAKWWNNLSARDQKRFLDHAGRSERAWLKWNELPRDAQFALVEAYKNPPQEANAPAAPEEKPAEPAAIEGYSDEHPTWATEHEKDVAGRVIYSKGDLALVEGFSALNGQPVYVGVKNGPDGSQRTRVDIAGFTGKMFTDAEKAALVSAAERRREFEKAEHAKNPDGPFKDGARFASSAGVSKPLAATAERWLKMLGIEARVYLTTAADARTAEGLNGPFAAIRSGAMAEIDGGQARRLSNGDYYIVVNPRGRASQMLETLAHEIGHILEKEELNKVDGPTLSAITRAYGEWLGRLDKEPKPTGREWVEGMRAHTTAKDTIAKSSDAANNGPAEELTPYWRSFGEWFADQVARWATSSEKPLSAMDRFFKRIADAMRRLYATVAGKKWLPTKEMEEFLNKRGPSDVLPEEAIKAAEEANAPEKPTEAPKSAEDDIGGIFDEELEKYFAQKGEEPAAAPKRARAPRGEVATPRAERKPPAERKPRSAGEAAKSAAENAGMSFQEAIDGLMNLFGDKDTFGSGPAFDEQAYEKAKPFFQRAFAHFSEAMADVRDMARALIDHLVTTAKASREAIARLKPYIVRFIDDVRSGRISLKGKKDEQRSGMGEGRKPEAPGDVAEGQSGRKGSDRSLEGAPPEDGGGAGEGERADTAGARADGSVRDGDAGVPKGGNAADGRDGAGGAGVASEGAGERERRRPAATRPDYEIADPESLIGGTPKVRFERNRAAIETFRDLTESGRDPTREDLDTLARYIGWGSFGQQLFQGTWDRLRPQKGWEKENDWLRNHLGQAEWESAQNSIINAHYTDPPTVTAMWDMARRMGFTGGRVLEPSVGIGNFFGLMPRDLMAASDLTGIELDQLTGGMAKILYPGANVQIKGYQDSKTADGFYDLVIGNWPFAQHAPADRRYAKLSPSLHDYFFLKALDQVRPGGLVVGITSRYTMDKQGRAVRAHLARNAELVAAYRLPAGAFEKYAGTGVVTDIIILKKREAPLASSEGAGSWLDTTQVATPAGEDVTVNQYFALNRANVLGTINYGHGTTTGAPGLIVDRPSDYARLLSELPSRVPENVMTAPKRGKEPRFVTNNTKDRQGSITTQEGKLYVVRGDRLEALEDVANYRVKDPKETAKREDQVHALVQMRRLYGDLIDAERDGAPDVEQRRKVLNGVYSAFRAKHGPVGRSAGLAIFDRLREPFTAALTALERPDGSPSRILTQSTIRTQKKLDKPTVRDAFVMARNEALTVDLDRIAELANRPRQDIERELLDSHAIYRTPGGGHEVADVYLSGNVRRKLREAQEAGEHGEDMEASIKALEGVLPKDIPYFQIEAKLGATWVPNEEYQNFLVAYNEIMNAIATPVRRLVPRFPGMALRSRGDDPFSLRQAPGRRHLARSRQQARPLRP
jgi:hypothetical protein